MLGNSKKNESGKNVAESNIKKCIDHLNYLSNTLLI